MSVAFLTAAFAARTGKSSTKSVLIALADRADDKTGLCFPSVFDIVERTELDRKTVLFCLKILEEKKFLIDTGKRIGKTNQVKIWRLDFLLIQEASQKRDSYKEASQKRNGSGFPPKESLFSVGTVPKTGYGTTTEPSLNKTTTTPPKVPITSSSGVFDSLIIEPIITQHQPQLLGVLIGSGITDPATAQNMLDELVGTIEAGVRGERTVVGNPSDWLHGLINKGFVANRCFAVQARRKSTKASAQRNAASNDLIIDHLAAAKGAALLAHIRQTKHGNQP